MAGNKKPRNKQSVVKKVASSLVVQYTKEEEQARKNAAYAALTNFKYRKANKNDWNTLSLRIQVSFNLANKFFKSEGLEPVLRGAEAVRAIYERFNRTKAWGAGSSEINDLYDALEASDDIQDQTTRQEQREAYNEIMDLLKDVSKGKV